MLEILLCTMMTMVCVSGAPVMPATAGSSAQTRQQTMFDRINAARAARQGTVVTTHQTTMPHRSERKPVTLEAAWRRRPDDARWSRRTMEDLFVAPYRYNVHYHRIRCAERRRATMRYYGRLNSTTYLEEANMRRALASGLPMVVRKPRLPHAPHDRRVLSDALLVDETGLTLLGSALNVKNMVERLPVMWPTPRPAHRPEFH